jgi:hypothetical protein
MKARVYIVVIFFQYVLVIPRVVLLILSVSVVLNYSFYIVLKI